jgi:hypothetical protein
MCYRTISLNYGAKVKEKILIIQKIYNKFVEECKNKSNYITNQVKNAAWVLGFISNYYIRTYISSAK